MSRIRADAFLDHGLSAIRVEENQRGDSQENAEQHPPDTADQCSACLVMGGSFFELQILLKFTQGQRPCKQEENHSAKHDNDDAISHFPAGTSGVAQGHQDCIRFESKVADQIGEKGKEADQANNQPGLPAPELGQGIFNIVNDPFHAFLPRFERVRCAKFDKGKTIGTD